MGYGYKRVDLQANAQSKIDDALLLFKNKSYSNAYYLSGYAVEIGLKACIARHICNETVPDKDCLKGFLEHKIEKLIGLAGLKPELDNEKNLNAEFAANWAIVSEWSPDVRYESKDITSAQEIISAISDEKIGVLQWIKKYW